ncbi:unnamed protein product [Gadus morhua 'NCC']
MGKQMEGEAVAGICEMSDKRSCGGVLERSDGGGREGEKEEQPEPAPGLGAGDSGRNMRGPPHHIKGELQGPGPVSAPNGFPDAD